MYQEAVRIGTLAPGRQTTPEYIRQIMHHGFESFSITFWKTIGDTDLKRLAREVKETLAGTDIRISCLGIFGNPLELHDEAQATRASWESLIDAAHLFDSDIVAGFAGRLVDRPIPESVPRFKEVFGPMAARAADRGVRLAFENCDMGGSWERGDWNMAQNPAAWELMFDAVPAANIGLQWEPAHQLDKLIDPMPQLRKWVKKIFHLHGKDASVYWDVVREYGVKGGKPYSDHRTPGFGDSNWTDIISELRRGGFVGSIDIEGWHDPVYRQELEMMGQVRGLNYLKQCRGGAFAPNPS